jgi:hypothetical protein
VDDLLHIGDCLIRSAYIFIGNGDVFGLDFGGFALPNAEDPGAHARCTAHSLVCGGPEKAQYHEWDYIL